jgi:pimeloyl-ACP methyl ester carboxylesterase
MSGEELKTRRLGDVELAFRIRGEGPPLLLFHGGEGDHQIYDRVQDALGETITSISFDQRDCGHARYDGPDGYTLVDVVDDAVRLLDALGHDRADVLGNSIGGVMAQIMAVRWPDRVGRLILGLTWPADESLQDLNPEAMAKRARYVAMGAEGVRHMAELSSSPKYLAQHPELLEDLASLRTEPTPEARARRMAAFTAPLDIDPGAIGHQTLIIGGEADQLVPARISQRLASRIPQSRFAVLPGAGHLAAREYPEALAAMIREFLDA